MLYERGRGIMVRIHFNQQNSVAKLSVTSNFFLNKKGVGSNPAASETAYGVTAALRYNTLGTILWIYLLLSSIGQDIRFSS